MVGPQFVLRSSVYNYALILCLDASLNTGPDLALETLCYIYCIESETLDDGKSVHI